jgi:hypothetical protein
VFRQREQLAQQLLDKENQLERSQANNRAMDRQVIEERKQALYNVDKILDGLITSEREAFELNEKEFLK